MVRGDEEAILPQAAANGVGYVAFSPLNQGLLTGRYLTSDGSGFAIPEGSRMSLGGFLKPEALTDEYHTLITSLAAQARENLAAVK